MPRKGAVTKLDGTKYFGFIEVTDDYTIRITNDSGITRVPISQLDQGDFQKYGFQKDRSKDGRFWYERKEALKDPKVAAQTQSQSPGDSGGDQKAPVEIRLSEISALQPLISAYEKTLGLKKSEQSTNSDLEQDPDSPDVPFTPMFSEPGLSGPLPQPFSSANSPLQSLPGLQPSAPSGSQMLPSAPATGLPPPR